MKWTTEKPTEPGWYHYRHSPHSQREIFELRHFGGVLRIYTDTWRLLDTFHGQWAGPIPEPLDSEEKAE